MKGNDLSLAAWKRVAVLIPQELQGYAREWAQAVERLEREGTDSAATLEWELWRSLCDALKESGAVTDTDLKTSRRIDTGTAGDRLLKALIAWADARRAHAKAEGK